jgi:hypothetical protein
MWKYRAQVSRAAVGGYVHLHCYEKFVVSMLLVVSAWMASKLTVCESSVLTVLVFQASLTFELMILSSPAAAIVRQGRLG